MVPFYTNSIHRFCLFFLSFRRLRRDEREIRTRKRYTKTIIEVVLYPEELRLELVHLTKLVTS